MLTRRITHGIVASRFPGKLHVVPSGGCEQPATCDQGCTSCGGKRAAVKLVVATPDADRYPPGSRVVVTTFTPNEAVGALIVFGIPLFLATSALLIRYVISPSTVESPASLIGAGCAFAAGFVVVGLIDGLLRRRYPASVGSDPTPPPGEADRHG